MGSTALGPLFLAFLGFSAISLSVSSITHKIVCLSGASLPKYSASLADSNLLSTDSCISNKPSIAQGSSSPSGLVQGLNPLY